MQNRLKITYLFESTDLWGGTKVALEQAELLSDAGYRITILSKDSGPTWYPLKLPVTQASHFDAETIPDSDIVVGTFWPTVKAAFEAGKGAPVHLCQGYEAANKELLPLKDAIDEVYSYGIPKLTVSPHMEKFLKERFNAETYYIGQMLNREIFYPSGSPGNSREQDDFRLLVVGPFEADVKNIPSALRGISLAKKRINRPLNLIRSSQFPLSKAEEEIIKPAVYHFHVPYSSMGEIYRDADLLVSVSKEAEGFGLPALEAMACGVPVILSSIPSYKGFDEKQDYALFVEPSDPEALADAIVKLTNDMPLRERLVRRGLEVAGKFSGEKALERLTAAFEEIHYKDKLSKTKNAWNVFHAEKAALKKYNY